MSIAAELIAEAKARTARVTLRRETPLRVRLTWICQAEDSRRRPCRIRTDGGRLCGVHKRLIERRARNGRS